MTEPLETRIAPAAVFKYTDVDGDLVTVKLAIGDINDLVDALKFSQLADVPRQLQLVDLDQLESPLQVLTITATPQDGLGDGFANVGAITTSGAAYGSFIVDGDLGAIFGVPTTIKKIVVHSLGALGPSTQDGGTQNVVNVTGAIGTLEVKRDLAAAVNAQSIGTLKVGGNILGLGGNAGGIGSVKVTDRLTTVTIGGLLIGGSTTTSGSLFAESFGSVTVGGMRGGSGDFSGGIFAEDGNIDRIVVKGDVIGGTAVNSAQQIVAEGITAKIKSLRIDGSLIGSTGNYAGDGGEFGQIYAAGGFDSIVIKHDLVGGGTNFSGSIVAGTDETATGPLDFDGQAPIGTLMIGGSVRGGGGDGSGAVWCDGVESVRVLGRVQGGSGDRSGRLDLDDNSARFVSIGGDLIGGTGADSGQISAGNEEGAAGTRLIVRGNIIGGGGEESGMIDSSQGGFANIIVGGFIEGGVGPDSGGMDLSTEGSSTARISVGGSIRGGIGAESGFVQAEGVMSLTIGGSIYAGTGARSGFVELDNVARTLIKGSLFGGLNNAGRIHGDDDNGSLTILGSVIGVSGTARIVAKGDSFSGVNPTFNPVAFTKLTIGGDVRNAEILLGYDFDGMTGAIVVVTPDVQLGELIVGGDWVQANLVVGAEDGADNKFGTADDARIVPIGPVTDDPATISRVGRVIIGGAIFGIPGGTDQFGFVAQEIGEFRFGEGRINFLRPGLFDPVVNVASTGDVFVREIV